MTMTDLMKKFSVKLSDKDFADAQDKLAVQVNLTGKTEGVFYVEILEGKLSVMPYEYIDHDAIVNITMTNLDKILMGRLNAMDAITQGKLKVEGNVDKVLTLGTILHQK